MPELSYAETAMQTPRLPRELFGDTPLERVYDLTCQVHRAQETYARGVAVHEARRAVAAIQAAVTSKDVVAALDFWTNAGEFARRMSGWQVGADHRSFCWRLYLGLLLKKLL